MEVKIGQYKGIEVEVEKTELTDEVIERQIQYALQQNPLKVEKDVIEEGNTAVFDFEGIKDGVPFDGGTAKDYEMVIGSHQFIPGFEEQMIGMKKGESKDLNVTFPENYGEKSLAGQPVIFKVTVHNIFETKPAELNEEFVKALNIPGVTTVEALREYLTNYLENEVKRQNDEKVQDAVFEKLMDTVEGDLPQEMVDYALQQQVQRVSADLRQQGATIEQYLQMTGQTMEDLKGQLTEFAQKQVKLEMALMKVAQLEKIDNVDDDVKAQYDMIASSYNVDVEEVKKQIPYDELAKEMKLMKASQVVLENAKVAYK